MRRILYHNHIRHCCLTIDCPDHHCHIGPNQAIKQSFCVATAFVAALPHNKVTRRLNVIPFEYLILDLDYAGLLAASVNMCVDHHKHAEHLFVCVGQVAGKCLAVQFDLMQFSVQSARAPHGMYCAIHNPFLCRFWLNVIFSRITQTSHHH